MNSALNKCLSIAAVLVHLQKLLVICAGAVIPYSCEKQSVCQGIYFPPFWKWRKGRMTPLGSCCVLVFASLPLRLSLQNVQREAVHWKLMQLEFLQEILPLISFQSRNCKAQSSLLFGHFFHFFFFFWKIDYEWLQIFCDKITQISFLLVWRT